MSNEVDKNRLEAWAKFLTFVKLLSVLYLLHKYPSINIFTFTPFQDGGHTLSDLSNATTSSGVPTGGYGGPPSGGGGTGENGTSGVENQVPVDLRVGGQQPPQRQQNGLLHHPESKEIAVLSRNLKKNRKKIKDANPSKRAHFRKYFNKIPSFPIWKPTLCLL